MDPRNYNRKNIQFGLIIKSIEIGYRRKSFNFISRNCNNYTELAELECMRRGVKILLWYSVDVFEKKAEIGKGVCAGVKIIEKSHVHI